jgi:hypothetical protein
MCFPEKAKAAPDTPAEGSEPEPSAGDHTHS